MLRSSYATSVHTGTVFAYGQTASGKTHTMMGGWVWVGGATREEWRAVERMCQCIAGNGDKCVEGIVQRAVQEIFALIAKVGRFSPITYSPFISPHVSMHLLLFVG